MAESPFGRLVGTWEFEPIVDGRSMGRGRATFEWIEGGAFVLERSEAEWTEPSWVENAPVSTRSVIGSDDSADGMVQLYSDSRDVFRIYRFRDKGRTIDGHWDSSPDGTTWDLDFPITYRRIDAPDR